MRAAVNPPVGWDSARALLLLAGLKRRHLWNFLAVQGSSWQTLLRGLGLLLLVAFLQFVTFNIVETLKALPSVEHVLFVAAAAMLASGVMLWVFDMLVFVSDEFQVGTDANDFEFLLALPVGFPTVVWAKVLLRAVFDLVGVALMAPTLVAAALVLELPWYLWPVLYLLYFVMEVLAGLAAVVAFFGVAQVVSVGHLEALRLLMGFAVPFVAAALLGAKGHLLAAEALQQAFDQWGSWIAMTPVHTVLAGLAGGGRLGRLLTGAAGLALAGTVLHVVLVRMQHLASSLAAGLGPADVGPGWQRWFGRLSLPWEALVLKDLAMLVRRRVSFITVALMPLGIVAVNILTISAGAGPRQGIPTEILTLTSMAVPLLFLPYMMAAQSLGQIEYARIPFLQAFPVSARYVLQAKALLWSPPVFVLTELVHLAFVLAFGRFSAAAFLGQTLWIALASLLMTHLAVATAAMFPVSENALFKQQGATLTAASLFYLTGSLGALALIFPLAVPNRLALFAVTALLVHFVLEKAAQRLEYYDQATLLSAGPGLRFGEAFIIFDAYICLYLLTNVAIALTTGMGAAAQVVLGMAALLGSQLALALATAGYLGDKGYSIGAAWQGRGWRAPRLAVTFGLGAVLVWGFVQSSQARSGIATLEGLLGSKAAVLGFLWLFAALVSGPICEEIFFRGLLYRSAVASSGRPLAGLLVSSLFFAIPHYFLAGQFWPSLALGLLCGGVFALGGGLRASILAHSGFNTASLFLAFSSPWARVAVGALAALLAYAVHRLGTRDSVPG